MPFPILDRAYRILSEGGVPAHRVVIASSVAGGCDRPSDDNNPSILGITQHGQTQIARGVTVRMAGVSLAEAAGSIALGEPVVTEAETGRVKAATEIGTIHVVGFALTPATAEGDLIEVMLAPHRYERPGT